MKYDKYLLTLHTLMPFDNMDASLRIVWLVGWNQEMRNSMEPLEEPQRTQEACKSNGLKVLHCKDRKPHHTPMASCVCVCVWHFKKCTLKFATNHIF